MAIEALNKMELEGRKLAARFDRSHGEIARAMGYVELSFCSFDNLPYDVSEEEFLEFLKDDGAVQVKVSNSKRGVRSLGRISVKFKTPELSRLALTKYQNYVFSENSKFSEGRGGRRRKGPP